MAGMPMSKHFDAENAFFLTADADMFTFSLEKHVPNLKMGKRVQVYAPKCCNNAKAPKNNTYIHQFAMNTICMNVGLWRTIMRKINLKKITKIIFRPKP